MNNQLNVSSFCSAVTKGLVLSWETNEPGGSFTSGFDSVVTALEIICPANILRRMLKNERGFKEE